MILGLILALASAVATNLACLFKQRGAVLAPPIRVRNDRIASQRGITPVPGSRAPAEPPAFE